MTPERKEATNFARSIIIFIGPEGSGKTSQAERLAQSSSLPVISTGNEIRRLAKSDEGPLGEECREMFAKDTYLSGETLMKILGDRLKKEDTKDGFILDGGLRTLEETVGFADMIAKAKRDDLPIVVFYLKIPNQESLRRLVHGEKARKRDRDTEDGVKSRLNNFYLNLEDRLKEIRKFAELVEIDALKPKDDVYEELCRAFMVSSPDTGEKPD
jgi:adenylate kinase